MRLYGLIVLADKRQVASAIDDSSIGYFQRPALREFLAFTAATIAGSCDDGMHVINEQPYVFYARVVDGLVCVAVCDNEYPWRAATRLTGAMIGERAHQRTAADTASWIQTSLEKHQDATTADPMAKIASDLSETQAILHESIQAVLKRGENLDELVSRSDKLSQSSKVFYRQARRSNACCVVC